MIDDAQSVEAAQQPPQVETRSGFSSFLDQQTELWGQELSPIWRAFPMSGFQKLMALSFGELFTGKVDGAMTFSTLAMIKGSSK